MELRRTLILIAMAVVSYFLFLSWQHDYSGTPTTADSAITRADTANAAESDDLPDRVPASTTSTDVPVAPAPAAAPVIGGIHTATSANTNTVRVVTDVLDVTIDTAGGDIVRVALPTYTKSVNDKTPFVLMDLNSQLTYIAQSGLVKSSTAAPGGLSGLDDASGGRPVYTVEKSEYDLGPKNQDLDVVLRTQTADGLKVSKTFHFVRGDNRIHMSYDIDNTSSQPWSGVLFGQLKRDASKDPSSENHSFGMVTFLGGAYWTPEKTYNKIALAKFAKNPIPANTVVSGGWVAMVQHYFVSAWIPSKDTKNTLSTRVTDSGNENFIGFTSAPITVAPGSQGQVGADFYAGPKIQDKLKAISSGLELTVDYGWLWPIAQFLFWLLKTIHGFLGNWGWSIVMLTVLVKGAFFHLSATSYRSMANMRRVMPEMQRMKEQFGPDRAKLSQAMMELYKREKINPLGGCLPIVVQMPVFIALYWTLMESVELRHAGWIFWIKDLSLLDPYFILPLLMGCSMFAQQMLNPAPQDPMQAKVMKFMPVIFTAFFLFFPSGLVLYWLVNNLLSITQQWVITRQIEKSSAKLAAK